MVPTRCQGYPIRRTNLAEAEAEAFRKRYVERTIRRVRVSLIMTCAQETEKGLARVPENGLT